MNLERSLRSLTFFTALFVPATAVTLCRTSYAHDSRGAQICSVGAAAAGQQGAIICKDITTGVTTQAIGIGVTVSAAGGIGGSIVGRGGRVLVTNQAGGALLFKQIDGYLRLAVMLQTNGEGSLSGALSGRGAYVLTGTVLRFFPHGQGVATSSQPLLRADGSAAAVTVTGRYAYVSEKSGSLEAFPLGRDGNLAGPAAPVSGVSPGVIVGITGYEDLVVAPVAHLASDFNQAEIAVASALGQVQRVPTKEAAACWTANDDGEVCVSNPGSMTVSCGHLGPDGFESYTSAAASLPGESAFDLDLQDGLVGVQAVHGGAPVLLTYRRGRGDFLTLVSEFPVGTATAAGALLIASPSR